jgi:hypothetical protein
VKYGCRRRAGSSDPHLLELQDIGGRAAVKVIRTRTMMSLESGMEERPTASEAHPKARKPNGPK